LTLTLWVNDVGLTFLSITKSECLLTHLSPCCWKIGNFFAIYSIKYSFIHNNSQPLASFLRDFSFGLRLYATFNQIILYVFSNIFPIPNGWICSNPIKYYYNIF
jgi:hypothetical protein